MKSFFYLISLMIMLSCDNIKKNTSKNTNCDQPKLVNFVHPIQNYKNENTLIYSLKTNENSNIVYTKHSYRLGEDSLLYHTIRDGLGIMTDSVIFSLKEGIPELLESYTKEFDVSPDFIRTKNEGNGGIYCEFNTFESIYSYIIPTEKGDIYREYQGITSHLKYTKETFKGIEYNCAIFEANKSMKVIYEGITEQVNGKSIGCSCENLGELYSIVTLENGLVITQQLIEVVEGY